MSLAQIQVQGSPEWLESRRYTFNASEAGAVMGCNPWFPKNKEELALQKYHDVNQPIYASQQRAMEKGLEQEPLIRKHVEDETGVLFEPVVMEHSEDKRFRASLDGISLDGETILEIKNSHVTYEYVVKNKKPPKYYYWQIQHQFLVSGSKTCIFAVRSNKTGEITSIEVTPNQQDMQELREAWIKFEENFRDKEAPELERTDLAWEMQAVRLREIMAQIKELEAEAKEYKQGLIELAGGVKTKGFGVTVYPTRSQRVDWKAIQKELDVDTSKYTKVTESWTVRVS